MCGFIFFQSVFGKALLFRRKVAIRYGESDVVRIKY